MRGAFYSIVALYSNALIIYNSYNYKIAFFFIYDNYIEFNYNINISKFLSLSLSLSPLFLFLL